MDQRRLLDIIHDQRPVKLTPDRPVKEACKLMHECRIGAILVVDEADRLIGIFTARDAVSRVVAQERDPAATPLYQVMTRNPTTMPPGSSAIEALRLMQDGGHRHVPITEGERVVGIVSKGDFRGMEQARLNDETDLWERI